MIDNAVYNFVIPCFIFELSTILYDWRIRSFCLQKVKKMYKVELCFQKEIDSKNFSSIDMPFET